ncbi:MAG: hypothetical protein JXN62_01310 [Bacteroidales bacterium]|nr:hypothetical protein [Bacteroidales bacterium]
MRNDTRQNTEPPRILIFGQPFNYKHGGGITLSNLFRGWETRNIAVAATGHVMHGVTSDICKNYYQLGYNEFRWRFPFNLVQRKYTSGVLAIDDNVAIRGSKDKSKLRQTIVNRVFYPFLEWSGLFHKLANIRMTMEFKRWLSDFQPQILYLQVSTRDTILFATGLIDYLRVPSVIHIMDDWPSTISRTGLFRKFWKDKVDREFKNLLGKVDLFLSISDAMSSEYKKRYGKNFIAFHNPIDIRLWSQKTKTVFKLGEDHVKVLFSGRIGIGVADSLLDLAKVVESLSHSGVSIKLYVQSPSNSKNIMNKLERFTSLVINPVADYSKLPGIFSGADILVIVNDFDRQSVNYLKYSMPTKASEYMISGTPILVYSHSDTAVSAFFSTNRCGLCVTERNLDKLGDALITLVKNEQLRRNLSASAVSLARELFDAQVVRKRFQNLITQTSQLVR